MKNSKIFKPDQKVVKLHLIRFYINDNLTFSTCRMSGEFLLEYIIHFIQRLLNSYKQTLKFQKITIGQLLTYYYCLNKERPSLLVSHTIVTILPKSIIFRNFILRYIIRNILEPFPPSKYIFTLYEKLYVNFILIS